jgi:hypothetical protein
LNEDNKLFKNCGTFVDLLGSPIVFLHEINTLPNFSKIISQVDGIEKYDRAISIARPNDVVLTKSQPEKSYLNWLRSVNLGTDRIIVLNGHSEETLPERVLNNGTKCKIESYMQSGENPAILSPYFGGLLEQKVSTYLNLEMYSQPRIVKKYDSKINFKILCRKIGVPVIDEEIFIIKSKHDQTLVDLAEVVKKKLVETGKVILRGEYGASASTTYVLDNLDREILQELITSSKICDRYMVESFYETKSDPSSVWFISKNSKIFHIKTSNQILDEETSHVGNEFPVQFDDQQIIEHSYLIARQFMNEGYIGPFGLDYIETNDGFFAAECNPRVTGSMYPWELVNRLENINHTPIYAARSENFHMPRKGMTFSDLQKLWEPYLYDGQHTTGVLIPFNVGPISNGKISVLGTGSSKKEVASLIDDARLSLLRAQ